MDPLRMGVDGMAALQPCGISADGGRGYGSTADGMIPLDRIAAMRHQRGWDKPYPVPAASWPRGIPRIDTDTPRPRVAVAA